MKEDLKKYVNKLIDDLYTAKILNDGDEALDTLRSLAYYIVASKAREIHGKPYGVSIADLLISKNINQ